MGNLTDTTGKRKSAYWAVKYGAKDATKNNAVETTLGEAVKSNFTYPKNIKESSEIYYNNPHLSVIDKNENKDKLSQNIRSSGYANLRSLQKKQQEEENNKFVNKAGDFILKYHPLSVAAQYAGKKLIQSKIAENIDPYSYGNYNTSASEKGGWANRAMSSIFTKEANRKETERLAAMGVNQFNVPSKEPQLRIDLLNMYAGNPQKYNSFTESKYKPTIGADKNQVLYDSPALKGEIFNEVSSRIPDFFGKPFKNKEELKNIIFNSIGGKIGESGENISTKLPALGQGTLGVGEDEKGVYISYSDKWDLNPTEGASSQSSKTSDFLRKAVSFATKKAEEYGVVKPPNIYGRIYLDKKTGLPIKD